jgi:hypothetical protein
VNKMVGIFNEEGVAIVEEGHLRIRYLRMEI